MADEERTIFDVMGDASGDIILYLQEIPSTCEGEIRERLTNLNTEINAIRALPGFGATPTPSSTPEQDIERDGPLLVWEPDPVDPHPVDPNNDPGTSNDPGW